MTHRVEYGKGASKRMGNDTQVNKLRFAVASAAFYGQRSWIHGTPLTGMNLMAELAHSHDIPVTWLMNSRSAYDARDMVNGWHEKYGDDVALILEKPVEFLDPRLMRNFILNESYETIRTYIQKEKKLIQESLPWAKVNIAASAWKSVNSLSALEDLGFDGLWGNCWEQLSIDVIGDCGCPFTYFYMSKNSYKVCAPYKGKVVGIPWTASADMANAYHKRNVATFCSDPDDMVRYKLCDGRETSYAKQSLDKYVRNASWNPYLMFVFHEEAHEMEHTEVCSGYSREHIDNTTEIMDEFYKYVRSQDVVVSTLGETVLEFKRQFEFTPPPHMLFHPSHVSPVNMGQIPYPYYWRYSRPESPDAEVPVTFFYFDNDCQLVFVEGRVTPLEVKDYMKQHECNKDDPYPAVTEDVVEVSIHEEQLASGAKRIQCELNSRVDIPYGLTIWGDFSGLSVSAEESCTNYQPACTGKIIDGEVLFIRMNLNQGNNSCQVVLESTNSE